MRTVREVMTKTVVTAPEEAPFKELVRVMREYRVSALPIVGADGSIVGVVSEADLLLKEAPDVLTPHVFEGKVHREERRKAEGKVARDLVGPAITIGPDAPVTEAAKMMHERHVKRLPVVDELGRIAGVVCRVDLLADYLPGRRRDPRGRPHDPVSRAADRGARGDRDGRPGRRTARGPARAPHDGALDLGPGAVRRGGRRDQRAADGGQRRFGGPDGCTALRASVARAPRGTRLPALRAPRR